MHSGGHVSWTQSEVASHPAERWIPSEFTTNCGYQERLTTARSA
jgi:hypothetical protein